MQDCPIFVYYGFTAWQHASLQMEIKVDNGKKRKAEAMVTPRRKCRRPAMVTPKSYPYP